jgi:hypothetical protein
MDGTRLDACADHERARVRNGITVAGRARATVTSRSANMRALRPSCRDRQFAVRYLAAFFAAATGSGITPHAIRAPPPPSGFGVSL